MRNQHGLKDSIDMYRTVKGERYIQWQIHATDEQVKAYRAAGVRVRRFVGELFVHEADVVPARTVFDTFSV